MKKVISNCKKTNGVLNAFSVLELQTIKDSFLITRVTLFGNFWCHN